MRVDGGGDAKDFFRSRVAESQHVEHARFALCDGAGFVHRENTQSSEGFEICATFYTGEPSCN